MNKIECKREVNPEVGETPSGYRAAQFMKAYDYCKQHNIAVSAEVYLGDEARASSLLSDKLSCAWADGTNSRDWEQYLRGHPLQHIALSHTSSAGVHAAMAGITKEKRKLACKRTKLANQLHRAPLQQHAKLSHKIHVAALELFCAFQRCMVLLSYCKF